MCSRHAPGVRDQFYNSEVMYSTVQSNEMKLQMHHYIILAVVRKIITSIYNVIACLYNVIVSFYYTIMQFIRKSSGLFFHSS